MQHSQNIHPLTHETTFSDADIFFVFLLKKAKMSVKSAREKIAKSCCFCILSLTCRKWANTMFMYMSSSSLPLPMKHKCSPLAMEPDSKDCFCASKRDFTERANSDGFWSICGKTGDTFFTPFRYYFITKWSHTVYITGLSFTNQVRVQVKGSRKVPSIVLFSGPTIHHKKAYPILKIEIHSHSHCFLLHGQVSNSRNVLWQRVS